MTVQDRARVLEILEREFRHAQGSLGGWVQLADLETSLAAAGIRSAGYGYPTLSDLLSNEFPNTFEIAQVSGPTGTEAPVFIRQKASQEVLCVSTAAFSGRAGKVYPFPCGDDKSHASATGSMLRQASTRPALLMESSDCEETDAHRAADGVVCTRNLAYPARVSSVAAANGAVHGSETPQMPDAELMRQQHDTVALHDVHATRAQSSALLPFVRSQVSGERLRQIIRDLQRYDGEWVHLANVSVPLRDAGIDPREFGYPKLRPFLSEYGDVLELRNDTFADKPPIWYVRPRPAKCGDDPVASNPQIDRGCVGAERSGILESVNLVNAFPARKLPSAEFDVVNKKEPNPDLWLYSWAFISPSKIRELTTLALEEPWNYGAEPVSERNEFPLLKNYLAYTYRRLSYEDKILMVSDPTDANGTEYAAFNTGLVDRRYEYIYALFRKNAQENRDAYWYLVDFVIPGEGAGKTLVRLFNPLPMRADYFEHDLRNAIYDPSTGHLSCDYMHILTERLDRFPLEFLEENCGRSFLEIGGQSWQNASRLPMNDDRRKKYFKELGEKISNTPKVLNRLRNRLEDAIDLAQKKAEWDYKTAIPMYHPKRNSCSLLLPLSLVDEDTVDLALVAERQPNGNYIGQTVLPLNIAYSNSRLICRPDSEWLRPKILLDPDDGIT